MRFSIATCRNFSVKVKSTTAYSGFTQHSRYPVLAIEEFYNDSYDGDEDSEAETYVLLPDDDGKLRWVIIDECLFAGVD